MGSERAVQRNGRGVKLPSVSLRLRINAVYKVVGSVSGEQYVFDGVGNVQSVDARDVGKLLLKKTARGCCMGLPPHGIFEIV